MVRNQISLLEDQKLLQWRQFVLEIGVVERAFIAFLRTMRLGLALAALEAHGLRIGKVVI